MSGGKIGEHVKTTLPPADLCLIIKVLLAPPALSVGLGIGTHFGPAVITTSSGAGQSVRIEEDYAVPKLSPYRLTIVVANDTVDVGPTSGDGTG